jgi:hypothetical protein
MARPRTAENNRYVCDDDLSILLGRKKKIFHELGDYVFVIFLSFDDSAHWWG